MEVVIICQTWGPIPDLEADRSIWELSMWMNPLSPLSSLIFTIMLWFCGGFFWGAAHCVNQKWIWKTITKSGSMPHSGMEHCVCPLSHSPMISQFCGGFFGCWSLPTSKVNLEDNYQIRKHATWWDGLCSIEIVKIIECWTICGGCNTFQMQKVKWTRLVAVLTLKHTHFCLFSFSKNWPSFLKFRCAKCH